MKILAFFCANLGNSSLKNRNVFGFFYRFILKKLDQLFLLFLALKNQMMP
jgi:hypothetical protein